MFWYKILKNKMVVIWILLYAVICTHQKIDLLDYVYYYFSITVNFLH